MRKFCFPIWVDQLGDARFRVLTNDVSRLERLGVGEFGPYNDRLAPMACIAAGDIEGAIAEVQRCAKLGFKGLSLPCKPKWGPPNHEDLNYNLPSLIRCGPVYRTPICR